MTTKRNFLLLSLCSALLLSLAWYWHLSVLIFFGFVPLLILEDELSGAPKSRLKLFAYAYLTFLLWNLGVSWWVVYASFGGACMAWLANALLMAFVFLIFSNIKRRLNKWWAVWLFIPLWIAWEHAHTLWDLTWTWLTLGNVFAFNHTWVQWYEFTGTSGGTLWALAANIFIFQTMKNNTALKLFSKPVLKMAAIIFIPILISFCIYAYRVKIYHKVGGLQTVIVQPNIDPYNEKFYFDYQSQFFKALNLVRGKISEQTEFLVLPETFITENLNEAHINESEEIQWFRDSLISKFPKLKIIAGANTYKFYENEKDVTSTARLDEQSGKYYDVFNTALYIDKTRCEVYHKSKLVPGVERMPFPALLKPLENLALDMGGTMGSLGVQDERSIFEDTASNTKIAPPVCYESVYADYMSEYIRKGANLIFIITNDGWWDDSPGYVQHLNYARLRAIENRRPIARCANTGISCFIDETGNISNTTEWWKETVIDDYLIPNNKLTFFSRFGDLISYFSVICSLALIVFYFVKKYIRVKQNGMS
ncbi:MAG: apolipoprotein N-acyltransferase [Bacteroidetes bacterium]|nr:apolipoprotein N-acyltransferase [Bacteroidota bacterium]